MAAPSAGSPAVILNATASAVQLVSKQLAGAADAYRAARLHFAGTLADLAAKEGFFAAALPAVTTLGPSQHGNAASGSQASSPAAGSAGNAASFAGTPLQALVDLLRPLITSEPIPGVQSAAVSCLGRIMQAAAQGAGTPDKKAARGRAVAECIVLGEPAHGSDAKGTVYALVAIVAGTCQISSEDPFRRGAARPHPDDHAATLKYLRRASLLLLRHLASHSSVLPALLDAGLASAVVNCLIQETDKDVREQGAWCLGIIARSGKEQAQHVADAGAFGALVECLKEAELSVRKTACAAIADIVKWSPDLATSFLGTSPSPLPMLAAFLRSPSPPLRTQSLSLLTHIAKHPLLAEKTVLSTGVAKAAVVSLHPSRGGRERWAGVCWCAEIARGGAELARLLVDAGAAPLLVQFAAEPPEVILSPPADPAVPAIATLGHIAGYSALLAHACVAAGSTPAFSQILQAGSPAAKESAAWSLAQACKWSAAHAADALPVLPTLLRLSFPDGHRFLRAFNKLLKAVEDPGALISCILALPSPDPASQAAALSILARFLPILATSLAARKEMVRRGALGKVLEYDAAIEGSAEWKTAVDAVRRCFPEEVVRYYTPGYSASLLNRLDEPSKEAARPATPKQPLPVARPPSAPPMAAAVVTTLPLNEQAIGTNDEIEVHLVIAEPAQEVAFIQAMPEQIYASDEKPSATKPKSRPTTASEEPMTPTTAVAALPEPSIQQPTSSTPAFTPDRDPEDFAAGLSPSFVSLALSYRPPSAARTIGSVEYCGQSEPRIEVEGVEEEQVVDAVPAEAEAVPPIEQVVVQPIEQPVVREEHEQIQPGLPDGTQDDAAAAFFGGSVVDFISPPQPMQTIEEPAPPAERPFAVDRNSQLDLEAVVFDSAKDEQQNEAANEHQAEEQIEDGEDDYMSEAGFEDSQAAADSDEEEPELPEVMGGTVQIA